jgi:hypothetical protein
MKNSGASEAVSDRTDSVVGLSPLESLLPALTRADLGDATSEYSHVD